MQFVLGFKIGPVQLLHLAALPLDGFVQRAHDLVLLLAQHLQRPPLALLYGVELPLLLLLQPLDFLLEVVISLFELSLLSFKFLLKGFEILLLFCSQILFLIVYDRDSVCLSRRRDDGPRLLFRRR